MSKTKYRIRNWRQYNKSLVQRGSITIWFSEDSIDKWSAEKEKGKKGRPFTYSDDALLTALVIRSVFHLPLRALEGFLQSIVFLMGVKLVIPCYTQISRRAKSLGEELAKLSNKSVKDLVIDSTGLKVYGEGEWKVRKHGIGKRRTWRKLHLAVDPISHAIILESLTENSVADCEVLPDILDKAPDSVKRYYGDGAYDTNGCYRSCHSNGIEPIVPPQKNAVYRENAPPHMDDRNHSILEILGLGGDDNARKLWKRLKKYHLRSLSETAMFRFKTLFGGDLKSKNLNTQQAEVKAKCIALNTMTSLGMPRSKRIAP